MLRPSLFLFLMFLLFASVPTCVAALVAPGPADAEDEIAGIAWMTDLDAARAKAKEESRPLLVVFR